MGLLALGGDAITAVRSKVLRATREVDAMRRLLVLGAGTAGTMGVNKLRHRLSRADWQISVVDASDTLHQPGFLFVPFGRYTPDQVVRPRRRSIPDGVDLIRAEVGGSTPRSVRSG